MKLYYAPGACSMAPHIAAKEAGIPVELVKVEFGKDGRTAGGRNFYDVSPQGAVPVLELDDGTVLTENQVLLQYLAFHAVKQPTSTLAPPGDNMEHWRFLETLNFIATELHKGFSPLFGNPPEEFKKTLIDRLNNRFALLEGKLGDKQFLVGDHFTVADAYAFVPLAWAEKFGIEPPAKLKAYHERLKQRPGVRAALQEEGLLQAA